MVYVRPIWIGESGGRGKRRDWSDQGYHGGTFSNPPLISGIVFFVGNFNHSYQVPPFYCLGASGFLSCSSPSLRRLLGTSANGVADLLVVLASHKWGTGGVLSPRGGLLVLAANACGDTRLDLGRKNRLTSFVIYP